MRLHHFLIVFALMGMGCTDAEKKAFSQAMTGSPPAATTPPSTAPPTVQPPSTAPPGTTGGGGGIIGTTQNLANGAAAVAAATAATPIGGYASLAAGLFSGILVLERLLLALGISLPNSKSSQPQSNSASAGGTNSGTGPPSNTPGLKAA